MRPWPSAAALGSVTCDGLYRLGSQSGMKWRSLSSVSTPVEGVPVGLSVTPIWSVQSKDLVHGKRIMAHGEEILVVTGERDEGRLWAVYKALQNSGIKACIYHGQMGSNDREMSHRSFIRDEVQVMVATVAFGMGIDKPNIRCVIHYGCPKNLESYYQESGRCGRDGLASVCLLYYSRSDFYKAIRAEMKGIMEELGDAWNITMEIIQCDVSHWYTTRLEVAQGTGVEWLALSCRDVTIVGRNVVCRLNVSLIGLQFLSLNTVDQTLILPLTTEMIDEEEHGSQQKKLGDFPNASILACEEFLEVEAKLFSMLLDVRFSLAKGDGIAPYAICGDETIKRLTKLRPQTRARLANIDGVNQHFLTRYGDEFISQIIKLSQELGLQTHCEGTPQIQATMAKRINTNMEKKLTPAVADAWKMWQQNGMSFSEVAVKFSILTILMMFFLHEWNIILNYFSGIGKEIRVSSSQPDPPLWHISSVLGTPVLCCFILLCHHCRKPTSLQQVTYDNIKAFLTMEELGLSAEEMSGYDTRTDVPNKKMESSLNINLAITIRDRAEPYCSMSAAAMASAPVSPCHSTTNTKQSRAEDSLHLEYYSPKKLQKVCENWENFGSDLVATKTAVLQWIMEHDKVGLEDIVKQFKGSKEESVLDLLACLECEFLIFKKNGLFQAM
ncbi:hypothetical protein ZIOFF_035427 [Zingiber officinale]|uniref:DNA 3'-5' helicase n=1 Tax=Zingiber officinale TaxID=94328 RepID=A0A8J5GGY5_ZINOF|nr:hypothetical protein ZIOFF_035427 [Zingiber officinale]